MPFDIADGLRSIGAAMGIAEKMSSISKQSKSADISEMIVELRGKLVDARMQVVLAQEQIADLIQEKLALQEEVNRLKSRPELTQGRPVLTQGAFGLYYKDKSGEPYCPSCYDSEGKVSLLTQMRMVGAVKCPKCGYLKDRVNL